MPTKPDSRERCIALRVAQEVCDIEDASWPTAIDDLRRVALEAIERAGADYVADGRVFLRDAIPAVRAACEEECWKHVGTWGCRVLGAEDVISPPVADGDVNCYTCDGLGRIPCVVCGGLGCTKCGHDGSVACPACAKEKE